MQTTHHVLVVPISVKAECIDAFVAVATENAENTRNEPGNVRFELAQSKDDPTQFTLLEVFKTAEDHKKHCETEHYKKFKGQMPDLLAFPYTGQKFGFVSSAL